jgi:threonine synthase
MTRNTMISPARTVSTLTHLECSVCGAHHDADAPQHLCRVDGGPLLARYDLAAAAQTLTAAALERREASFWRYAELLPVRDLARRVSLGEVLTPLLALPRASERYGIDLLLKNEAALPTGTFKARGAAIGISRARELGAQHIAMPTNGNAGSAWAQYAARAGMTAHVAMPAHGPRVAQLESAISGADLHLVDGLITDAGRLIGAAADASGWYDAATLKEPYRIEGKKTMGFEIAEQCGWTVPDVLIYPTGGGVGLIGIEKGLRELQALGLIGSKLPRMVVVQSTGCAPVVDAFLRGAEQSTFWSDAHTVAFGMTVPKSLGDRMLLRILRETAGIALAVSDADLLARQAELATDEGVFMCPEGGATLAAAVALRERGWIAPSDRVLLVNTGAGMKYPDITAPAPPIHAKDGRIGALP